MTSRRARPRRSRPGSTARRLAAAVATAAVTTAALALGMPGTASADGGLRLSVDWDKLGAVLRSPGSVLPKEKDETPAEHPVSADKLGTGPGDRVPGDVPWLGARPRVSLVARDWGGALLLAGHMTLTDQMRLSRSNRMVVTRLRVADGRLTPFTQLGLGQWRVDTNILPALPHDVEDAAQLAAGFELALAPRAVVAVETDLTILYRSTHEPQMFCSPDLWGAFLAARAEF
jgi:hypothetical protein